MGMSSCATSRRREGRVSMTDFAQPREAPEVRSLLTSLGFGESPRWHEGRLWFSNWGMQEVVAVGLDGKSEIIVSVPTTIPFCIDWLRDGRLLVVSGQVGLVMRGETAGSMVTNADLRGLPDRGLYR